MAEFAETDEEKKKRQAKVKKRIEEIKARRAREEYDRMLSPSRVEATPGKIFGKGGALDFSGEINSFK